MLSGCTGEHKITEGEDCLECHAEEKQEFDAPVLDDVADVGLTFTVETHDSVVYLCSARFGGDTGERAVPTRLRTLDTDDLRNITVPEPGIYLLCTGDPDSPRIAFVRASKDVAVGATITL